MQKTALPSQPSVGAPVVQQEELKLLGHEIKESIRNYVNPGQFSAYFSDTFSVSDLGASTIEFTVTTNFIKKVIETQYLTIIKKAINETLGREYQIDFKTFGARTTSLSSNLENILKQNQSEESFKKSPAANTFIIQDLKLSASDKENAVNSRAMEQLDSKPAHGYIDSQKKFSNFVVGPSNNLANASALAVARDPGQTYPSLYVYGNSGLGKTHLIHAIANHILEQRPHLRICITTCNNMVNEYVDATQSNTRPHFIKRYTQDLDVLIIDDIHDLAGKTGTQEQFFHIFNDLSNRKKQLIFTSDKTPKEIAGIEDRIRTRLSSALAVEIQQPDLETRIAILKTKAQERDFYIGDEVVNLIAKCVKNSVRDLEGYLVQLKAYYDITHVDIDLEIAREYLKLDEHIESQKLVTVDSITKAVAQFYKIPLGDIRGKSKTKEIVLARQVAMYLIHQHLRKTLLEIAYFFGKKDHTTPMYSLEVVKKRLKTDQQFAQHLLEIENLL
ncbi:MAG: chromosomal replication initiator protein DnaA [Bacteriovoracaceae bacterium]|nr:chromosomal replication initiator protein DnaA [Bacteriovoracaceae bacterium]